MKSLFIVLGWILLSASGASAEELSEQPTIEKSELILEAPLGDSEADLLISDSEEAGEETQPLAQTDAATSESEIALFPKSAEAPLAKSIGGTGATFLTLAVGFVLMLGGFLLMRRWVRKKAGKGSPLQIKIIGQHYLGPKRSLAVVRVAGESILIGITDHNISCIKALSLLDEELPAPDPQINFSESLSKVEAPLRDEEGENFSVAALTEIKDRVSTKLRDMREL